MSRLTTLLTIPFALLITGVMPSCAAHERQEVKVDEEPTVVRIVSFVIAENSEESWSRACRRLAAAAIESRTDANWLIHQIDDRNYYLVSFGSPADFQDPNSPIEGFARHDVGTLRDEFAQLRAVEYTVSSDEVWEQVPEWGTTSDQNSLTHPGVDQRSYRVDSRHLAAADSVLKEMAGLLKREGYPFPMEGFRVRSGPEVIVHIISFFGARREYYSEGQPEAFLEARGELPRWLRLEERLNAIARDRSRIESRYRHELSYDPWLLEQLPKSGR